MRSPVKRLKLYEAMKSDIASGVYLSGAFLPNEFELADKYGYSRETVRWALTMLEDDRIIELLKCKGRRIRSGIVGESRPLINFLLPCAGFLSETPLSEHAQSTRRILSGVSQIAFEYNCRVETVPVSPTNNRHEINWSKLDFVNSESRLVISGGYWYCDLFPLFKERGCKVAFIENQTYEFKLYADYIKEWYVLSMDRVTALESAVKFLAERGCRRIALVHCGISEKDHPVLHGYKSGLAKCGLRFTAWLDALNSNDDNIGNMIAGFYKKNNFDALLLDPYLVFRMRTRHSLHYCLGLPAGVKFLTTEEISYNHLALPSLSSVEFSYEEMGRIAAKGLLENQFRPGQQFFNAGIVERESTMHEVEQLVLT